jgi:hypothetical protein
MSGKGLTILRHHLRMVAAAITIWTMFSVWLIVPLAGLPGKMARVAGILVSVELIALLTWSYGTEDCSEPTCAPLAQAAGIAARTDIPALAAAFLFFAFVRVRRLSPGRTGRRRRATSRGAGRPPAAAAAWPPGGCREDERPPRRP